MYCCGERKDLWNHFPEMNYQTQLSFQLCCFVAFFEGAKNARHKYEAAPLAHSTDLAINKLE